VFLEVFPRVLEVVLRLCRDHERTLSRRAGRCVYHIHLLV
jgi:hypothetical protein